MQALKSPFLLLLALACHLLRPESSPVSLGDLFFFILFSTSPVCKNSSTGPFRSSCVPASFQCCFVCKVCASALPKGEDHAGDVNIIFLLVNFSSTFLSLFPLFVTSKFTTFKSLTLLFWMHFLSVHISKNHSWSMISQQWHYWRFRPIKCLAASPPVTLCSVPPHPTGVTAGQKWSQVFSNDLQELRNTFHVDKVF